MRFAPCRCAALVSTLLLLAACAGGAGQQAQDGPLPRRPLRPSLSSCVSLDGAPAPSIERLPGAVRDASGWRARVTGTPVVPPPPAPLFCSRGASQTVGVDSGGHRWVFGYALIDGGADVTPSLAPPSGEVTLTLRVEDSFAAFQSLALTDEGGMLAAVNAGALLLDPADTGGVVIEGKEAVAPTYSGDCGRTRDRVVSFDAPGLPPAELRPGERAELGAAGPNAWNVDAYTWLGTVSCTDLTEVAMTLAWRSPPP
ncbi:MAG: hypothetical protein QM704_16870 [Anaeromyxobacteraceae bacterium]